jgi:vacuolar protein sorting-associated protein 13A/C
MRKNRANNLLEGVEQGMISLVTGVGDGIKGVVMQPIHGAQEDGAKGFFKGIGKGLAG